MAKQLQIRGGTTVQHSTFTGALREITIDTDKDVVVVHDGTTVGGFPLAKQTSVDSKVTKVTSTDNAVVRFNGTTGDVQNSGVIIDDNGNVGVGVTPSAWTHKTLQINGCHILSQGLAHSEIGMNTGYSGGNEVYLDIGAWAVKYIQRYDGAHQWQASPPGTAGNAITWTNAMTLDTTGNLLLQSGTGALGYGAGSGGTVTQLTSKSTAVTLNKPTGTIITANTALAAGAVVQFIVACSSVTSIYDTVYATQESAAVIDTSRYEIRCAGMYGGSFVVSIKNVSGTSYSEAIPIKFIVFKGAIS